MEPDKMSKLLVDLRTDLLQGRIEDTFTFAGRTWRLHTLNDGEAVWRDQYVSVASNMALLSSRKCATVAASITHIDDHPVSELFTVPNDPQIQGLLKNSAKDRADFYRERLFEYLSEFDDAIITQFFLFYSELEKRREGVIENLKGSSRGTTSSTSSSTSSPADGPSAPRATEPIHGSSFVG